MLEKKCILLLYGEGRYDSSIMAVKDYIEGNGDAYVVAISDKDLYPFFRYKMAFFAYRFLSRGCAWVNNLHLSFNTFWTRLNVRKSKKECKELVEPNGGLKGIAYNWTEQYRRIRNMLLRYNPEVVVCSTPKLLRDTVKACDKAKLKNIDICGLVTDYCLDARFVNFKANRYFVQNNDVSERLVSLGVEEDKISVVGTPLSQDSKEKFEKSQVLEELGINNDKMNIVIVGGRYGQSAVRNVFTSLAELENDINIIVLSGGNSGLIKYCELITKNRGIEDKVFLIEEIDKFAKLYSIADIFITSPTASITYEAMYHNSNLVLCNGGDSLENRNSHYLATNQLALLGRNNDELVASISKFMSDGEFANDMLYAQNEFVVPDCDKVLGDMLIKIADQNRNNKLNEEINAKNEGIKQMESLVNDDLLDEEIK
ncbi:MAG: glycosyltransferase, partial [Clostridia bacterium]|nr:glycosyltransferase [Clostridia bacterium]